MILDAISSQYYNAVWKFSACIMFYRHSAMLNMNMIDASMHYDIPLRFLPKYARDEAFSLKFCHDVPSN